jgi:hypothetical protein
MNQRTAIQLDLEDSKCNCSSVAFCGGQIFKELTDEVLETEFSIPSL